MSDETRPTSDGESPDPVGEIPDGDEFGDWFDREFATPTAGEPG